MFVWCGCILCIVSYYNVLSLWLGCYNYNNIGGEGIISSFRLIYRYFMRFCVCMLYNAICCSLSVGVYGYGLCMVV